MKKHLSTEDFKARIRQMIEDQDCADGLRNDSGDLVVSPKKRPGPCVRSPSDRGYYPPERKL